jgi:phosphoglycolate phosphatase-like HAD superfamily hydrolase
MPDHRDIFKTLPKRHEFLICADSDGTVFDTMPPKHRCFRDCLTRYFERSGSTAGQATAEVWKYVNLDSIHRGENRFRSLLLALDLLRERGEDIPETPRLRAWVETEPCLGNPALRKLLEQDFSEEMNLLYHWSIDSDTAIAATVHGIQPFPHVRDFLTRASENADLMVVSHTPCDTLKREWKEHGIDQFVMYIAGQECGSKTEHIRCASEGKYPPDHILMIGDSPGDLAAAEANRALFFPIIPGHETESWQELSGEGLTRFFKGNFAGDYQEGVLREFRGGLLAMPPWRQTENH